MYDENDFHLHLANPSFKPPGEEIDSYILNSKTYTVYKSSLREQDTIALVNRLQILTLLFIEGATYIDTTDDRWQIYTLYIHSLSANIDTKRDHQTKSLHSSGTPLLTLIITIKKVVPL